MPKIYKVLGLLIVLKNLLKVCRICIVGFLKIELKKVKPSVKLKEIIFSY